jgi:hypothetical protein
MVREVLDLHGGDLVRATAEYRSAQQDMARTRRVWRPA